MRETVYTAIRVFNIKTSNAFVVYKLLQHTLHTEFGNAQDHKVAERTRRPHKLDYTQRLL